ncbi:MAG: lysozyme [Phyllobacteriaceae bacterium]|nr:lysozyme [Phyllobacteriaceae bacterium]
MNQTTSPRGVMDIIAHEAIVLSRYKDVKGIWTIGVGHTAAAGGLDPAEFTGKLTLEEAIALFRTDLGTYERRVRRAFTKPLKQHEFDAAVSFDFNTGAIDRATWVATFNQGDRDLSIEQILNWRKPPQIIPRRQKEQRLFATGTYASDGTAMLYPATRAGRVLWNRGRRIDLRDLIGAADIADNRSTRTDPETPGFWASMINRIAFWR